MTDANDKAKPPKKRRPALTVQQIRFCEIYAEKGNATEAYLAAGFTAGSRESAHVMAWRLLRNRAVADLIRTLREEACDAARISVNRLAQAMARIAFADRSDLFDEHGCLLPASQWPADVRATVESIENEELLTAVSEKGQPKRRELRGF